MENRLDSPIDRLWDEYSLAFKNFDDLTLARWMSQTLSQFQGFVWRFSHPLVGTYRLAAQWGHERQIWHKRLVTIPAAYVEAPCCRAPLLPLVTREVAEAGLLCAHCAATAVPFDEIPENLRAFCKEWAGRYAPIHAIAHEKPDKHQSQALADKAFEEAARAAEKMLVTIGRELAPNLLDHFPAVIWEDQDECLEVRPEDVLPC